MSGGLVGPSGGVVDVLYPVAIRILVAPIGPLMPSLLLSIKPEIYWVLALRLSASGQFWSVLNGRGCLTPALSLLSAPILPPSLCVLTPIGGCSWFALDWFALVLSHGDSGAWTTGPQAGLCPLTFRGVLTSSLINFNFQQHCIALRSLPLVVLLSVVLFNVLSRSKSFSSHRGHNNTSQSTSSLLRMSEVRDRLAPRRVFADSLNTWKGMFLVRSSYKVKDGYRHVECNN